MAVTGSVLDERPLPWIIAFGVHPDSETGEALRATGGDVKFCSSLNQVSPPWRPIEAPGGDHDSRSYYLGRRR